MADLTWAALVAGNQHQGKRRRHLTSQYPLPTFCKARANTAVATSKEAQPPVVSIDGQTSAAATSKLHAINTTVDHSVVKAHVPADVISDVTAASPKRPPRKSNWKKKKTRSISKPLEPTANNDQELSGVPTASMIEASRKAPVSKKSSADAAGPSGDKPLTTANGERVGDTTMLIAPSTVHSKKKKKTKSSRQRNKAKATENVGEKAEQSISKLASIAGTNAWHAPESNVRDLSNKATMATRTHAAPVLDPPIVETEPLGQSKLTSSARNHRDSMKSLTNAVKHPEVPRARSVVAHVLQNEDKIRLYVKNLRLPGVSYDAHGVCIASDAPEWVRGRIARRVQLNVCDLSIGRAPAELIEATELELERQEKLYFGEATWDRLFKIEMREETTKEELQEVGKKLAVGFIPYAPVAVASNNVDMSALKEKIGDDPLLPLPMQQTMAQATLSEQDALQPFSGFRDTVVPIPDLRFSPQAYLPPNMLVPGVQNMTGVYPYIGPLLLEAPLGQQGNPNPHQKYHSHKKQLCKNYAQGYCYYGSNCLFLHTYPRELQGIDGLDRRDSAHDLLNSSRSVSRSSTSTAPMASQDTRVYDPAYASRAPSGMSVKTIPNILSTAGSQGSAEGSSGGHRSNVTSQKKTKGGDKSKTGKKYQVANK
ncbi:hypothetical protein SLS60_001820 [Paraconiothyrium brasiliense]|uniref:C3H1-type domain-containing protein n=1 Tax=Paraconiothyrium brasiliense TaxID=300254 RepID=A0ABR3S0F5_9PLEO